MSLSYINKNMYMNKGDKIKLEHWSETVQTRDVKKLDNVNKKLTVSISSINVKSVLL